MCGIAGAVWNHPEKTLTDGVLRRMTDALAHRGPDGAGFHRADLGLLANSHVRPGIALGHRRLAIVDIPHSQQPISNEDDSVTLILNGEIYNFRALRHRLEARGHRFRTQGDAETIVHLYEDEGPACVERLDGMFAFALWDAKRGLLLLARDRLGEKPLVYCEEPHRLLFASELKALLQVPGVSKTINPSALDAYLTFQYVPHPLTIFAGMSKLPPGHRAIYRDGKLDVRPYWRLDFSRELKISLADARNELRARLTTAVEQRLQGEAPLGAFLSGGVDSMIIASVAAKKLGRPLKTFALGYATGGSSVQSYDETRFASLAAAKIGSDHSELRIELHAADIVPRLILHLDEPMADSSAVPTWYLAEFARQKVTVALTGDGGDELFGGYRRYLAVQLASMADHLPHLLRWILQGPLARWLPSGSLQKSAINQWKRFAASLSEAPPRRYCDWVSIFNEPQRARLYREEYLQELPSVDPANFVLAALQAGRRREPAIAACLADTTTYLPCDLLTKVDMISMAQGLECRAPFLDHRVVEFAAALPAELRWRFFRGKRLLREAFAELLPAPIARRSKMGFAAPLDHWFRGEMRDFARQILFDRRTTERPYFRPNSVERIFNDHLAGKANHSQRLWSLLIFELWQRQWID